MTLTTRFALVIFSMWLSACSTTGNDSIGQPANTANDIARQCPPEANLIRDPGFATLATRERAVWSKRYHARGGDFVADASDGLLTIRKVGEEPWFLFTQVFRAEAGAELQFDALVTLDTHEPKNAHGFGYYSGLYIAAKRGSRSVASRMASHTPNIGTHPEQRLVIHMPIKSAGNRLEAGFIHQAGGEFTVREPRLVDLTQYPQCRLAP